MRTLIMKTAVRPVSLNGCGHFGPEVSEGQFFAGRMEIGKF